MARKVLGSTHLVCGSSGAHSIMNSMHSPFPETEVRFLVLALLVGGGFYALENHEWNAGITTPASFRVAQGPMTRSINITAVASGALNEPETKIADAIQPVSKSVPITKKITSNAPALVPKEIIAEPAIVVSPKAEEVKDTGDPNSKQNISLLTFSSYGGTPFPGKPLSFSVVVENSGSEKTSGTFNVQLFLDKGNDSTFDTAYQKISTRILEPGENETKIWRSAWVVEPGVHQLRVCADVDKEIPESLENDNCASLDFSIEGASQGGDLVVLWEAIDPPSPKQGDVVSFSASIQNSSGVKTKVSTAFLFIDNYVPIKFKMPGIAGGEQEPVRWNTIWRATAGEHAYKICADGFNDVWETNEDNNCVTGNFFVVK